MFAGLGTACASVESAVGSTQGILGCVPFSVAMDCVISHTDRHMHMAHGACTHTVFAADGEQDAREPAAQEA